MKLPELINENELKKRYFVWRDKNYIYPTLINTTADEYAEIFSMPEADYTYYRTVTDDSGDLLTVFKGGFHLDAWQTKSHKNPSDFEFYFILKTLADSPDVEPFPMGYIIIKE